MTSSTTVALFERFLDGDEAAAAAIHDRFAERLRRLAGGKIGRRLAVRADADDVLQSAFRTFFVRAMNGQFTVSRSGQLWRLLARITVHKVQKAAERHQAGRRDVRREVDLDNIDSPDESVVSCPVALVALEDEVEFIIKQMDARDGDIFCLGLSGVPSAEIAEKIGCSVHTVRRVLKRATCLLETRLQSDT